MKYKYLIMTGIFTAIVIGVGLVLAISHDDKKTLEHSVEQERDPVDHDHEHGNDAGEFEHGEKNHDEGKHEDDHDPHGEIQEEGEHDEQGHGEASDIVEMTRAQQAEIGLTIATARSGNITQILSFVGEVHLNEDRVAHIVPMVSGIADSVPAALGEKVREGQVLALIDSPELAELKATYMEKFQNLELTRRTFERKKYLRQEEIASEVDLLEAQAAFQNAETMLRSATSKLAVLGFNDAQIRNLADGKLEAFGRYTLTSPITGTIIAKHITRGEKVGDKEVYTVADLSEVWIDLQIPAKDIVHVKKGQRVKITTTEGNIAESELTLVGPVVNKESRTALGRVVLPNSKGIWMPGIFVTGQIIGEVSSSAVVVFFEAIQNINGQDVVFVPEGDGFKPVEITAGKRTRDKTEILSGLKPGDPYVAKGAFELKAMKITSGASAHAGHGH
ncbi:MAG: efflux RND transporter periplasmic adaptor subunit [Deltaproteobacteria bacterium]|nr:efflux RND transporter periplasmic adaptor subunit [Deltaproteobacteria bacterium]